MKAKKSNHQPLRQLTRPNDQQTPQKQSPLQKDQQAEDNEPISLEQAMQLLTNEQKVQFVLKMLQK